MKKRKNDDWLRQFEKEYAVVWNDWGADFAWADNSEGLAGKIINFISDVESKAYKKGWEDSRVINDPRYGDICKCGNYKKIEQQVCEECL